MYATLVQFYDHTTVSQINVIKHDNEVFQLAILLTNINTLYYTQIYHYILIVRCFLLICSPDVLFHCLFKYMHRPTIFSMIFHDNFIPQFGANISGCVLSGIGLTM